MRPRTAIPSCLALFLVVASTSFAQSDPLSAARAALERGDPNQVLTYVSAILSEDPDAVEALLLQSTAHFMLGEVESGRRELDRVLELDPGQRQAWLNRAGLAIADEDHAAALEAFERARELDPDARDNDLNLGATHLLLGDLARAAEHFERYLSAGSQDAESFYVVASNYAMGGYAAFALRYLHQAIQLDEKVRRRARRDPNFVAVEDHARFLDLMSTDIHVLPADSHRTARSFQGAYDGGRGPLLQAVLDALYALGEPFDPNVEVTEDWALVWGRFRIKLRAGSDGGVVELSAPGSSLSAAEFDRESKRLFDSVFVQLPRRLKGAEEPGS